MKFLLGFGVGWVIGVLLAPATGAESRQKLASTARGLANLSQTKTDQVVESAKQKAGELGGKIGQQTAEAAVEGITGDALGRDRTA